MADTLKDDEATARSARTDRFRRALQEGNAPDWEPFLSGVSGQARIELLQELVVIDLNLRWDRGEKPTVEDYLVRFPELAAADGVAPLLVVEEHRCRIRAGEVIDADGYRSRFPALFPGLQTALDSAAASWTIAEDSVHRWEAAPEGVLAVAQQYELVRELGRGMFGEVWLARKKPSGIEKAIKILLQPADRDAAQRELKALELIKNLRHPYLLATEDFWITNNRLHVVMELADGTLRSRLADHLSQGLQGVPIEELFRYIAEAAEGLDYLHEQKITHRDVKPDNILLLHGHAKVADFGLARAQVQFVDAVSLAGTPAYMAPEVWDGEGGPASDLYSLAFLYAELRQGRSPLLPRPLSELLAAHRTGAFEFTAVISEPERAVLRRALAQLPRDRHPSCTAFVADLGTALNIPFAGRVRAPETIVEPRSNSANVEQVADREPAPLPRWHPSRRLMGILLGGIALAAVCIYLAVRPGIDSRTRGPQPAGTDIVYPTGTTPDGTAVEQLLEFRAASWVIVQKGEERVRFRLIAPQSGPAVPPFYISETKITNRIYSGGDDSPVMNVPGVTARTFAQTEFNGDLPSEDQWDHAVGYFDQRGRAVPTLPPGRAWIGKAAPGSVHRGAEECDSNQYGLLDMAGNGREWTRTIYSRGALATSAGALATSAGALATSAGADATPTKGEKRDLATSSLTATDKLVLRGRMFTLERPLSYAIIEMERTRQPQTATPTVGSPYTGFRVVLSLP